MKKRKGFTLIELLAVILILAIIALIAIPSVISIIEKSRKASFMKSAEGIRRVSENYYIENSAEFSNISSINFDCDNEDCITIDTDKKSNLGAEGAMGVGYVKIYKGGNVEFLLSNGKYCVSKYPEQEKIEIYDGNCKEISIDVDKVEINKIETYATTKSILVKVQATAGISGISGYQFYIDGNWTDIIKTTDTNYEYVFKNLTEKNHQIKVRAYNGTYGNLNYDENLGMAESEIINVSLMDFEAVTIISSSTDWKSSKTYTISGTTEGANLEYKVVSGTTVKQDWTKYSSAITVDWISTTSVPTYIYARFNDNINTSDEVTYTETKIDTTGPTVTLTKGTVTTKSIQVVASATDNESGIKNYQFSKDNGATWTSVQTSNVYTFSNLSSGTYNIKVKVYNNAGLSTVSSALSITTATLDKPTFTVTGDWSKKTVTINYPSVATIKQYSIDGGTTWNTYTGAITFTSSGNVVAKASDGVNTVTNTYNVLIDTTVPVASITVYTASGTQVANGGKIGLSSTSTIRFNCTAGSSGVAEYQYSSIHQVTYNPTIESKTITSTNSTYNYKITPSNLTNSYGNKIKSGEKIQHTLICKSNAGYISSAVTFTTEVVDDTLTLSLEKTSSTTSSITVRANASSDVGIAKYEFKIDDGTWINNGTTKTYTFNDIDETASSYTLYTRVTNNVGTVAEANISVSRITCEISGTCTCSNGSLSGSVVLVCKDLAGNEVSRKTLNSCSGSCVSSGSGGITTGNCGSNIRCGTRSDGTPMYGDCLLTCTAVNQCTYEIINCS